MKKLIVLAVLLLSASNVNAEWVNGHWKDTNRDGVKDTYIMPYNRTAPDNNLYNNYSTRGNYNPYTGQQGTVTPQPNYYQNYQPIQPYNYQPPSRRSYYR